jgi:thioredoxin reductase
VEQGKQAVEAIKNIRPRGGSKLDLIIVGAGPAGFAASLTAKAHGLNFVTLEQESLGGCVFQYPRGKLVMTHPVTLPIVGKMKFSNTSKEHLLEFWREAERRAELEINYHERVQSLQPDGNGGFIVHTPQHEYAAHSVLLAIGRRGTPQKLGVPGEEMPKVVYRLIDPEQYAGQHILIVGGGDSALEAAVSVSTIDSTQVTLSYRGDSFARAKQKNRTRIEQAAKSGRVKVLLGSTVKQIDRTAVVLALRDTTIQMPNQAVIVNAGGSLPTDFLRGVGVHVETKYGTA